MKIIFTEGSDELNELLGFVDADIDVKKIRSDVFTATREIIALIGHDVYDFVVKAYEASRLEPDPNAEPDANAADHSFLIYSVQYPIAVNAYRLYAPSGDVAHTNNGRKMRNEDSRGEKSAFEWMINRDNEALEKRYYKALDTLLEYLDETNPTIKPAVLDPVQLEVKWKDTEAFLRTHKLFVRTTADFEEYFSIQSRLLLVKLQPGLSQCERDLIRPRIGDAKFVALKAALLTPALEFDEKLLALIKEACVYYALSWAMGRLRVSLLPDGILQRYSGERVNSLNTKVPEKLEAELVAQSFASDAEKALKLIESHVKPLPTAEEIAAGNVFPKHCFDEDQEFLST